MYLRTVEEFYVNRRWNTQHIRHKDVFKCDECDIEFALGHKSAHKMNGALTFCGNKCNKKSRSSGQLAQKWKQTKLARHGVEYSSQVSGAAEKMITTREIRTGARAPSDPKSTSNAQFKATMIERHGVEHLSKSAKIKEKKRGTYRDRYGVDNPFSDGSPFRDLDAAVKGGQAGYRALILKRGDKMLSKPEALLTTMLHHWYGVDNVQQQVEIQHGGRKPWLIDFYVLPIDTYVEADGVFWHGLNMPYEELHESRRSQYDRDRIQDEWFRTCGHRLVRITDEELMACHKTNDWSGIVSRLGG
jgi:hypothetical protein